MCDDGSKLGLTFVDEYFTKTTTVTYSSEEKGFDINISETKSVYLRLNSFAEDSKGMHAWLCSDN